MEELEDRFRRRRSAAAGCWRSGITAGPRRGSRPGRWADARVKRSGTGSKPPWLNGLQRSSRQAARTCRERRRSARSPRPRRPNRSARSGSAGPSRGRASGCRRGSGEQDAFHVERPPGTEPASASSMLVRHAGGALALDQLADLRAGDEDEVVPAGSRSARPQNASRIDPLDPVAVDGAADLAADRDAEAHRRRASPLAREAVEDEVAGRVGEPPGRRGRTRRCARGAGVACGAI